MVSVVLISGGLDSSVSITLAQREGPVRLGLTVDYGQRAAAREVEASRRICGDLGIPHRVVEARWMAEGSASALFASGGGLPRPADDEDLEGPAAEASAAAVWVPNRNGVLVNIGASFAERLGADVIVTGFNLEEAATFSDNSADFVAAATRALGLSTRNSVRVVCPVGRMRKDEILRVGKEVEAPLRHVWPCYEGGDTWCEVCESCRRFRRALERTGLEAWFEGRVRSAEGDA